MDLNTFCTVMGNKISRNSYAAMLPAFNQLLVRCGATTVKRVAMLCAQVAHESEGLLYMNELASGAEYEGRRDLGNIYPGDGRRYKGHGPIQVTGRANHLACSQWAFARGQVPSATYFIDHPEALGQSPYEFVGVEWFWLTHGLNSYADNGDVRGATLRVNGGYNGLADRQSFYNIAMRQGNALLPSGTTAGPAMVVSSPLPTLSGLPTNTVKALQKVVGTTQDGVLGPVTLTAFVKKLNTTNGQAIQKMQHYLNSIRSGYLKTHPNDKNIYGQLAEDNQWGPNTSAALTYYLTRLNGGFSNA